jgi:hypothetical protein
MLLLTDGRVVDINTLPVLLRAGEGLVRNANVRDILHDLSPPCHRLAVHRSVRILMHIVLVFEIDYRKELARGGIIRSVQPTGMSEVAVSCSIVCQLADHVVEFDAHFLETRSEHTERVVRDDTKQNGAHLCVRSFALQALLIRENRSYATWDYVLHSWVWDEPHCGACCVDGFVTEEEDDWEDGDDIAIGKQCICYGLQDSSD